MSICDMYNQKDQVFVMCTGVYCVVGCVCVCVCVCVSKLWEYHVYTLTLHADIHLFPTMYTYDTFCITDHAEWQLTGVVNFTAYV